MLSYTQRGIEMTNQEIVNIVTNFRDLIKTAEEDYNVQSAIVNEADKAFGDIRHYCENEYPTKSKDKTKVCKLINTYSKQRREAKDTMDVLKPLTEFLAKNRNLLNEMGRIANEMNKELKRTQGERKYAPRVLTELFEVK